MRWFVNYCSKVVLFAYKLCPVVGLGAINHDKNLAFKVKVMVFVHCDIGVPAHSGQSDLTSSNSVNFWTY